MERGRTLKENIEWLLNQYKKEYDLAQDEKAQDCEFGYSKDQFLQDADNVITELEFALKISK